MVVIAALLLNAPFFFVMEIRYVDYEYVAYFVNFGANDGYDIFSWIRACLVQFLPLLVLIVCNIFLLVQVRG